MKVKNLRWFAANLATAVSILLLFLPSYLNGGFRAALLIPIGLSGIGLALGRTGALWAGLLLLIFSIVGGFSVGVFYIPSAALFLAGFFCEHRAKKRVSGTSDRI